MIALIPLFPLVGFLINGSWYAFGQAPAGRKKASAGVTGTIATLAIGASFVVSLLLFLQLKGLPDEHRVIEQTLFRWMSVGTLNVDMAFRLDSLNTLFTMVITGIGTLIHLYSVGYMSHDATPGKFFSYLNLFCFAMLMLVLGASLPILFLGWEGVGLCSYLLIGYWYTDMDKAKAGKKAFVVNRIGDFGFLLGMFMIFSHYGTLDFQSLHALVAGAGEGLHHAALSGADLGVITTICLLLFVGCMGKSAQVPLYVWLPDAMAGPTPVSALIHAATMVTSGIYMVSRLNFFYSLSPTALHVVAAVGVFTAFFAATVAIVQRDIKKVLAYSTVSQLGYMFLACGVGAYAAGVFHVMTHAFFKALLFLGAGSVIHGMHEEQDIMKMGGLRKYMPITHATWLMGWLAICGVFPFSGFFSKDEILWQAFASEHGNFGFWLMGALTAVMTAFYMTRVTSLTFWGKSRFADKGLHHDHGHAKVVPHPNARADHHGKHDDDGHAHGDHGHGAGGVHESPLVMTIPLMVLAFLSVVGGFLGVPHMNWLEHWLEPVIPAHEALAAGINPSMEWVLMGVSLAGAIVGIAFAWKTYKDLVKPAAWAKRWAGLHKILENKWYVDEIYDVAFVRSIVSISQALWKGFDVAVLDRIVLSFGRVSEWTGQTVRVVQTGSIQIYALMLLVGIVASLGYLIYGIS